MAVVEATFDDLLGAMKRGAATLRDAGIPFLLAGGLACWARGGPRTEHDVDFLIRPGSAEAALAAMAEAGLRTERPPEEWLVKAYDGVVLIDLIFRPAGVAVDDGMFARAEELDVHAIRMQVASLDDVLATKLNALSEQNLDYVSVLELARSVREQINWTRVAELTAGSPYARAFMTLVHELRIAG